MWKSENYNKTVLSDRELIDYINCSDRKIIILEGPTKCGKTTIVKKLSNPIIKQFNEYYLRVFDDNNRIKPIASIVDEMNAAFVSSSILCLEDIDIDLKYKNATQKYIAKTLRELAYNRTIVLTGIDIREKCKVLLECINGRFFLFYP